MMRAVLLLAVAGLGACAGRGEPEMTRPDLGAPPEKLVLAALDKVKATDEQRTAVLNAYDSRQQQLTDLAKRSRELVKQWHKLDRTAADFDQQVEALAAQWAQVNADEMKARSAYERSLATVLDAGQWKTWQSFQDEVVAARRRAFLIDYDGPGGGRH